MSGNLKMAHHAQHFVQRRAVLFVVLAAVTLTGCPDNSILETEICLPAKQGNHTSAKIQFLRITPTFNFETNPLDAWSTPDDDNVNLLDGSESTRRISLEATRESIDVAVRVSYCESFECLSEPSKEESRFELLRPFAIGERRRAVLDARRIPAGLGEIVRYTCSGSACVPEQGEALTSCSERPLDAAIAEDASDLRGDGGAE